MTISLTELLPLLFDYYVPGYIFFWMLEQVLHSNNAKATIQSRVIFSAVVKVFIDALFEILPVEFYSVHLVHVIYIGFAIVLFGVVFLLTKTKRVNIGLAKLLGLTFEDNIWARVIGTDGKTALSITLKNGNKIIGRPAYINKDYIAMAEYSIKTGNTGYSDTHNDYELCTVAIDEIAVVETFYLDGSQIKELNKMLG